MLDLSKGRPVAPVREVDPILALVADGADLPVEDRNLGEVEQARMDVEYIAAFEAYEKADAEYVEAFEKETGSEPAGTRGEREKTLKELRADGAGNSGKVPPGQANRQ